MSGTQCAICGRFMANADFVEGRATTVETEPAYHYTPPEYGVAHLACAEKYPSVSETEKS